MEFPWPRATTPARSLPAPISYTLPPPRTGFQSPALCLVPALPPTTVPAPIQTGPTRPRRSAAKVPRRGSSRLVLRLTPAAAPAQRPRSPLARLPVQVRSTPFLLAGRGRPLEPD